MTLEELRQAEKELEAMELKLKEAYKTLPRVKPLLEFQLSFTEKDSPIFYLEMRCLNMDALKEQQAKDFANLGYSNLMISDYSEVWRHQMSYVLSEYKEQYFLIYLGGGNIHTRTDKKYFGYTLKLTPKEYAEIQAQKLPKSILSQKEYCDIA